MPGAVHVRARLAERLVDAYALHAVPVCKLPFEVVARDEVAEAGVERCDVVVLQVDLDEGLPVVIALVDFYVVEHVVTEIELGAGEQRCHVVRRVAWAFEQQAVAVA